MGGSEVVANQKRTDRQLVDTLCLVVHRLTQEQLHLVRAAQAALKTTDKLTEAMFESVQSLYRDLRLHHLDNRTKHLTEEERQAALSMPLLDYEKMPRPLKPPGRS